MRNKIIYPIIFFLVVLPFTISANAQDSKSLFHSSQKKSKGAVDTIINSATFRLVDGRKIRLIGLIPIAKPPRKDPPRNEYNIIIEKEDPIVPFEQTVYDFVSDLVLKKDVLLEFDNLYQDAEGYTLAYVFLEDGTFVNAEIIRQGYSELRNTPENSKYAPQLREAYLEAKKEKRGLQGE